MGDPARPEQFDTGQAHLRQVFVDCDIVLNAVGGIALRAAPDWAHCRFAYFEAPDPAVIGQPTRGR